jgi:hypothetical protein
MGLVAPEDGGQHDAAARDGGVQDISHAGSDASGAVDSASERDHSRDSAVDTARGSEGGHDATPDVGADRSVVDVTSTRDARVDVGVDANDAMDPPDTSPADARIDLHADIELDVTLRDVGADDVTDTAIDMGPDVIADVGTHNDGIVCGLSPPAPGGECPAVCNDGCVDGICKIGCRGEQQCKESTLECPVGFACEVRCAGKQSCETVSLICPQLYACNLLCTGEQSCKGLQLSCRSGTCGIECLGDQQACETVVVNCGSQACSASCSGSADRPTVNCGQSCDCRPCR